MMANHGLLWTGGFGNISSSSDMDQSLIVSPKGDKMILSDTDGSFSISKSEPVEHESVPVSSSWHTHQSCFESALTSKVTYSSSNLIEMSSNSTVEMDTSKNSISKDNLENN